MLLYALVLSTVGAVAAGLVVTNPGTLTSNQNAVITWVLDGTNSPAAFSIELGNPSLGQASFLTIASTVDTSGTDRITVHIPVVPSRDDYVLQLVDPADITDIFATSGQFSIVEPGAATSIDLSKSTSTTPSTSLPSQTKTTSSTSQDAPPLSLSASPSILTHQASLSIPSLSSTSAPPVSSSTIPPSPTQSPTNTRSKSLAPGVIVGITFVLVAALTLLVVGSIYLYRLRKKRRPDLTTRPHFGLRLDLEHGVFTSRKSPGATTPAARESSAQKRGEFPSAGVLPALDMQHTLPPPPESLIIELRAARDQLGALGEDGSSNFEEAMRQNEALKARIRAVERELQSFVAPELSDRSPPGYLD
ncbi:hypothetical protein DFH06DRAFT_1411630 [Mycena polygramma]|nr:hypothetical protein DFH06DRAFT_1411630 [Mycena polygramma]